MSEATAINFDEYDKLGLKPFCERLERFLLVEHDFVDGSLVVSLNAPFGSGKSTFLSMWKTELDKRRKADNTTPEAIVINAWESDYCGDPLLSLVTGLIDASKKDADPGENSEKVDKLREAAKDIGWFVTGLANGLVSELTGIDVIEAGELAEDKKKKRQPQKPDFVTLYEERTKALQKLKNTLKDVYGGQTPKVLIFVDELDRCRPDYAISYLETIKHAFDIHGIVFVLAVDYGQLESSAKALFGTELRFPDYFRKFVQRQVSLPVADKSAIKSITDHYVKMFLQKEGRRISMMQFDSYRVENICELFVPLRMTPRQIQETFRIIGHTVSGNEADKGRLLWAIGAGVILMSVLRIANPQLYLKIGTGKPSFDEVGKFLIKTLGKDKADWWFSVYVTGTGSDGDHGDWVSKVEKAFKDLGFLQPDGKFDPRGRFSQFGQGWGMYGSNRWEQIYQNIESAASFG